VRVCVCRYPHPFYEQLANLEYLPSQLGSCIEQPFQPLENVPLTFVRVSFSGMCGMPRCRATSRDSLTPAINQVATLKDLKDLAQKLDAQTEFAVDLEHHSYRTFQGFTCLMQVSTRTGTRACACRACRACVRRVCCVSCVAPRWCYCSLACKR
jgi:hypothetical protein